MPGLLQTVISPWCRSPRAWAAPLDRRPQKDCGAPTRDAATGEGSLESTPAHEVSTGRAYRRLVARQSQIEKQARALCVQLARVESFLTSLPTAAWQGPRRPASARLPPSSAATACLANSAVWALRYEPRYPSQSHLARVPYMHVSIPRPLFTIEHQPAAGIEGSIMSGERETAWANDGLPRGSFQDGEGPEAELSDG